MRREDLEHLVAEAGKLTGSRRIVVIGSQSVLATFPDNAPWRATMSMEADLFPIDKPDHADRINESLGVLSPFHAEFGYCADGVSIHTARLPEGWRERLVPLPTANTKGYAGLCLEVHDALIGKYYAGRPKDFEFCSAMVAAKLIEGGTMKERLAATELRDADRSRMAKQIVADFLRETSWAN